MTKFSWEPLDGGSLLLRVADGDRETTWKLTKRTSIDRLYQMLWEIQSTIDEQRYERIVGVNAMPTEAELRQASQPPRRSESFDMDEPAGPVVAGSEEESKAILQAQADAAKVDGKWFEKSSYELPNIFALGHGQEVD